MATSKTLIPAPEAVGLIAYGIIKGCRLDDQNPDYPRQKIGLVLGTRTSDYGDVAEVVQEFEISDKWLKDGFVAYAQQIIDAGQKCILPVAFNHKKGESKKTGKPYSFISWYVTGFPMACQA